MILIADSGATKTDWLLCRPEQAVEAFQGPGFNPVYASGEGQGWAGAIVPAELRPKLKGIKRLYFYGAGFGEPKTRGIMEDGFRSICPGATRIEVAHDLVAAARASAQFQPGVVGILGTGSNSCAFDGERIVDQVPNLGYLLGDEGSGADLGKRLLRAYFYRELPEELTVAFQAWGATDRSGLLEALYQHPGPNAWLAGHAVFLHKHLGHPFVSKLISEAFHSFLAAHVSKYEQALSWPIHLVGSVAFYFRDILSQCLEEAGYQKGLILAKPIDRLALYHCGKVPHKQE